MIGCLNFSSLIFGEGEGEEEEEEEEGGGGGGGGGVIFGLKRSC